MGKKKSKSLKGWALSKREWSMAQLGSSRGDSYSKYLGRERKRKNVSNLGRILEGPEGGRFTSSGRKKKQLPDEF